MTDKIKVITYNLNFIINRLEQLTCEAGDFEVNEKVKIINERVYEISDLVEEMEERAMINVRVSRLNVQ